MIMVDLVIIGGKIIVIKIAIVIIEDKIIITNITIKIFYLAMTRSLRSD